MRPVSASLRRRLPLRMDSISLGEVNRFLAVTVVSAGVTLGAPVLLHELVGMGEEIAVAVALFTAFCLNFFMARIYVFRSGGAVVPQLVRFAGASLAFRLAEYLAFLALHLWLDLFYVLAVAVVLVVSFVLKFLFYRVFVFGARVAG
jgi:putative flippase GtrA